MELPGQTDPSKTTAGSSSQAALPPQLSQANLNELKAARIAAAKIRRAVLVARFDGWSVGIFGALTFIIGLFSFWGFVLGVGMGIIAYIELRNADKLRRLEPGVIRTLALNQVALALLLIVYSAWSIANPPDLAGDISGLGVDNQQLVRMATSLVYGVVIAVAIFCQGGMALYYISREKYLRAYLAETPAWIIAMQQAGMTI